jgi:hypothetical protein
MRKNLFISALVIIIMISACSSVNSQSKNLCGEGKIWSVFKDLSAEGQPGFSFYIRMDEDTMINASRYFKVQYTNDSLMSTWMDIAFMREDTMEQCVYLANLSLDEGRIYDFSLSLNDTGSLYNPCYSQPQHSLFFQVISLDSIFIGGFLRKRWVLDIQSLMHDTIIEGMGSLSGPATIGNELIGGGTYSLQCFFENQLLIYHNDKFSSCFESFSDAHAEEITNTVRIYPVPFNDILHISVESDDSVESYYCIFDLSGRPVYHGQFSGSVSADLTALKSGVYFIRIEQSGTTHFLRSVKTN